MNFTVEWELAIRRELHQLWAVAPDPKAVWTAAHTAEQLLGADPTGAGRHLSEGLWQIVVSPLRIHYTIDHNLQLVEITAVALIN